jgi:aspartate/methionine/tyrosine aminotransferase
MNRQHFRLAAALALRAAQSSASLMTLLERDAYLDPGAALNVTSGYPEGLSPQWMTDYQLHPPADVLHVPPGEYASVICGWFARFFGCADVSLIPSCTMAFAIAAQALTRSPGDEFIVIDTSYDSYPRLLAAFGARVVYARRDADGNPDPESVRAACTARTRAVVIVCPDNPLGVVTPPAVMERLIAVCKGRGLTLLADYCLAAVNPFGRQLPVLPKMASSRGLSWIALGDTSKILGLNGSKFGALMYPPQWRERLEAATSAWFFQYSQYDLAVVASILSDRRFLPYLHRLSGQVGSGYAYLRDEVAQPPLAVPPMGGGCFALIDAAGLGLDDVTYARLLADRYATLVVPLSWFPAGRRAVPETRVRVSLNRPPAVIGQLAAALNASATALAGRVAC